MYIRTIVILLLGALPIVFAEHLPDIHYGEEASTNSIETAIANDEYLAASVATNLTASLYHRIIAIQCLSKNPHSNLEVLRVSTHDPILDIRVMAAEALVDLDPSAASHTAKEVIRLLAASPPENKTAHYYGFRAAALLAKLDDTSGFTFLTERLHRSPFAVEKEWALVYLPEFRQIQKLPAVNSIVQFIEETLPALEQEQANTRQNAFRLLPKAFNALYQLRAVEALPRMKQWEPTLPPKIKWILQYNMRGLETYANEENPHAPAP